MSGAPRDLRVDARGAAPASAAARSAAAAAGEPARAAAPPASGPTDPAEVRRVFGALAMDAGAALLASFEPAAGAEVLEVLPPEQAAGLLDALAPARAAALVSELQSDVRTDLLGQMKASARQAVTALLTPGLRTEVERLLRYGAQTAGGLMETEVLSFPASATIREVIQDLRANQERYARIAVQYLYVVDQDRRLVGVAPMRDLLLAPEGARLSELSRANPVAVRDSATTGELADLFDAHPFQGVPVIDASGVLLGAVNRADATESEHHELEEDYRLSQGIVGGEELRSMPVLRRARRRAAWLSVNLVLSLGGAAIIALQQGTIAKALVVAAVLPVISATSGNAAMQAAAVSIRELTLGVVGPGSWRRVLWHEGVLGALLAAPLGLAVAGLARIWGADGAIGVAVGAAMALNTMVAVAIGAVCPLALRRLNIDPALASGPITTTVADITGFALTLSFVSLLTN